MCIRITQKYRELNLQLQGSDVRSFVITIEGHEKSEKSAERCINSGQRYGLQIEKWKATTPKDDIIRIAANLELPIKNFIEPYSRSENCLSAFLSHYSLWQECVKLNETIIIFEHDAIVKDSVNPITTNYPLCLNLGKPSYGKYLIPSRLGVNPLTSKMYFPGAHAYMINPVASKILIGQSIIHAKPTDLFLNKKTFPFLQEIYPWTVECDDSFTTIQNTKGCLAKHNYNTNFEISAV